MDTSKLKKFAQYARRSLMEQVGTRMKQVLGKESAARRESPAAVTELESQIATTSKDQVIEKVAYTWFNRFCALRFMDANRFTAISIVSPEPGQFQPAILAEAKMGHIDDKLVADEKTRQQVMALLDGTATSQDPQAEAYRLLLVAACNAYNRSMPYLFERIADYTELLIPDDLLSGNAILSYVQQAMTPDDCKDVEIIGWLYQFYISEKKDDVFAALKKNIKIDPEEIPAATQLFTPHWIVRYLVENTLGRLWMLNNPNSSLIQKMDYYIEPVETETDFLKIKSPEELKICDPACGSGHMLSYAYDLLYAIYEEQGYADSEIPGKILTHNLYGVELDERAGELASFALSMKAAGGSPFEGKSNYRRFFRKPVEPNICILKNVDLQASELKDYMEFAGRNLFTQELQETLRQFDEADNFGSLIRPACKDLAEIREQLEEKSKQVPLLLSEIHKDVLLALKQADYLSQKYHVVVANPPYMGSRGMNKPLTVWLKSNYPNSKADLMTCFMDRMQTLSQAKAFWGMINLPSWMFLSSFETLRIQLLENTTLQSLIHLGRGIFGSDFGSVAFTVQNNRPSDCSAAIYRRLFEKHVQVRSVERIRQLYLDEQYNRYALKQNDFKKIPGNPIAYWVSEGISDAFETLPRLEDIASTRKGMVTARNDVYVRYWYEVSNDKSGLDQIKDRQKAKEAGKKWFSYLKGGGYRKWYGNKLDVVNWENDGELLQTVKHPVENRVWATNFNLEYIFQPNVNWGAVTSADFSARISKGGELFDAGGSACFPKNTCPEIILGFLNAKVSGYMLSALNPTLNFQAGNIANLPFLNSVNTHGAREVISTLISIYKNDWDNFEISWDFGTFSILQNNCDSIESSYNNTRSLWRAATLDAKEYEEKNNKTFIDAYNLHNEIEPSIEAKQQTLLFNPVYRYGNDKSEKELEELLLADTLREFISYSIGCMFGRYSLDKPGLILANQGDTLENYLKQVPQPSFMPDKENVIPILEESWFTDDMVDRFHRFLKVTFGDEHFEENLSFIEKAIGKDLRKFFVKDFYTDHLKRYKKRPIYWLFSSPRGSFNALIYMHRYQSDTVSVILNDYLREFSTKLGDEKKRQERISISANASAGEKTKALKQIDKLNKMIEEIDEYEKDVLFPLATKQQPIDLDDGVKHNYPLFGKALKKVAGLS